MGKEAGIGCSSLVANLHYTDSVHVHCVVIV